MPVVTRFFGIIVYVSWKADGSPHFHAKYGDQEVTIEIETGAVSGHMSRRALALVQEWRELHKAELLENWARAQQKRPLTRIEPLE